MPAASFQERTVLTLETRRGPEMSKLIATYGGQVVHAAAMREVPLASNPEALQFAEALTEGKIDVVIFLTGAGARALAKVIEETYPLETLLPHLRKTTIVARGPKPLAVLREWNVPAAIMAQEPNTWREVLLAIDAYKLNLQGRIVAVQEYGVSNLELISGLHERGARVTLVPVYQWDLPEDVGPLRAAVEAIIARRIDVVILTTGVQVHHLFRIAEQDGKKSQLKTALQNVVKASIGPSTSEVLRSYGLDADVEASRPKMGFLVREAAAQSERLIRQIQSKNKSIEN